MNWSGAVIFSDMLPDFVQGGAPEDFSFRQNNLEIENGILIKGKIGSEQLSFSKDEQQISFIKAFYEQYGLEKTIKFVSDLSLVSSHYNELRNKYPNCHNHLYD